MYGDGRLRICVVGSGTRFLSGISYYTWRLATSLARANQVSVVLMRQLLPTRLYPGIKRVGDDLTRLTYARNIRVFDGVDWFWIPTILRAWRFLARERPQVVTFQWWTGTVLHSYLALAVAARLVGSRVIIEFHEVLDPGEAGRRLAQRYVHVIAPLVVRLAHGFVVHSAFDAAKVRSSYALGNRPVAIIRHGPYDHHRSTRAHSPRQDSRRPDGRTPCCNLLYFGVIRPYKGLEDLIRAFDALSSEEAARYHLTIVGETWEGWDLPAHLITHSRYRDRITFVNRYVSDEEVTAFFSAADAVVLPYHRSSASGGLHIAMSCGLPVVVTRVGGLVEAAEGYAGAILIPPRDPLALKQALLGVAEHCGKQFADPRSWDDTAQNYAALLSSVLGSADSHEVLQTSF